MSYFKLSPVKVLEQRNIHLNAKQAEIIKSVEENKLTVCVATRRGGKSMCASACNVAKLLEPNLFCGITAPFLNHTSIIFDEIATTFKNTLNLKPTKLNNKDKQLKMPWDAEIRATTLKNRAQIAGREYALFTGDEVGLADYMENSNWLFQEVLPATIKNNGHILIISTPRGLNHLYDIWQAAEEESDWNRIRYTIWDVEHIAREEIERMERLYKERSMEKLWRQEFLAEFVSFEGAIFSFMPEVVETCPDADLTLVGIDPGSKCAFIKLHINKKHGVFINMCQEGEYSTKEQGKILQKLTVDSDLNVYDSAARQFAVDMTYEFDIPLTKAKKAVDEGINFLRRLENHIFISKDTDYDKFLAEWSMYSHKDGRIVKKNDHLIDATRYALYTAYKIWPEFFTFLNPELEDIVECLNESNLSS